MQTHGQGYTLIELLTVLSLLALLLSVGPALTKLLDETRQRGRMFELQRLVQMTRSHAASTGRITTICGSQDGSRCVGDWSSSASIIIFDDANNNRLLDSTENLIYRAQTANAQWHWRGSNRPYLRFRADGVPLEKGHFTLCPSDGGAAYASQLIINWVGRPRTAQIAVGDLTASEPCY